MRPFNYEGALCIALRLSVLCEFVAQKGEIATASTCAAAMPISVVLDQDQYFRVIRRNYVGLCVITFRVSRRRREMYCGHARLCVCLCVCVSVSLSAAACLHYCTGPDVTWATGMGCP